MVMTNAGFDGTVNEAQYAMMWAIGGADGVESSAAWAVTQGTGRQVSVAAQSGWAFAKGVVSKETAAITANLGTPTNGQFYLIVRRIDWTNNTVTIAAVAHTTTSTTVPTAAPTTYPTINVSPGSLYDQPLSWAWVNSVNTTVTLFDLRKLPLSARLSVTEDRPLFQAGRAASPQSIGAGSWTLLNTAWGTPALSRGFSFSSGVLTPDKSGWYRMWFNLKFPATANPIAAQVLDNSTTVDTAATILAEFKASAAAISMSGLVYLTAAQPVRSYVFTATSQNAGSFLRDLSWAAEWASD